MRKQNTSRLGGKHEPYPNHQSHTLNPKDHRPSQKTQRPLSEPGWLPHQRDPCKAVFSQRPQNILLLYVLLQEYKHHSQQFEHHLPLLIFLGFFCFSFLQSNSIPGQSAMRSRLKEQKAEPDGFQQITSDIILRVSNLRRWLFQL